MTPEGKIKAEVKKILQSIGAWYHMPVPGGYGTNGCPDFICCIRGVFVAIECKAPGKLKNTSANQKLQLELINKAGGYAWVIDDPNVLKVHLGVV
jgi:hypothetical protein